MTTPQDNTTNQHLTNARLLALQAIYAQHISGDDWKNVITAFKNGDMGGFALPDDMLGRESKVDLSPANIPLFEQLVNEIATRKTDIFSTVEHAMPEHIDFNKMEVLLKNIMALAVAEYYTNPALPKAILINEYVDITTAFFGKGEAKIVNKFLATFIDAAPILFS